MSPSLGSPIGKVKLVDVEDGTKNAYVPFKKYLEKDVKKACELAHAFETKLIRVFSFYHPKGSDPRKHLPQAVDQLGAIAEACHRSDLTLGLEIEGNLVGHTGQLMAELHRKVNHPAMVLIYDAANILCQGYSTTETYEQYLAMKPAIGWLHIKDYLHAKPPTRQGHVDEDALKHFVPADEGHGAHESILRDFRGALPKLTHDLKRRGFQECSSTSNRTSKVAGSSGALAGPTGWAWHCEVSAAVLDFARIDYHLRDFADIRAARGF